jgi:hypothetical protein
VTFEVILTEGERAEVEADVMEPLGDGGVIFYRNVDGGRIAVVAVGTAALRIAERLPE